MKIKGFFLMATIAVLALSACGTTSATQPSAEEILLSVNTAVALTSASQLKTVETNMVFPSSTPNPTSTLPVIAATTLAQPTSTVSSALYPGSTGACDSSFFISDVSISDGTVMAPGQTFTKTWKLQNTGTCTWKSKYLIAFSSGDDMSGEDTTIDISIPPNGSGNISVDLTAPDTDGTYTGYWILENISGVPFGNYVYVQIYVSSDASTSTPTATEIDSTVTPLPTETIQPTTIPTITVEPTFFYTDTPEPTATPTETLTTKT